MAMAMAMAIAAASVAERAESRSAAKRAEGVTSGVAGVMSSGSRSSAECRVQSELEE